MDLKFQRLNGFYRGTVLQHLSNGMCKVFVYGVFPDEWRSAPDMLPPAEQASALFAGSNSGNGVFSYPNIGATVWCFFANGDQNQPVYFASSLGGSSASMRWDEARCNATADTVSSGDDAYVHKIDVNKTTIKLWESGYCEIVARNEGEDSVRVVLDGKGNVIVTATQQLQVQAPSINIKAGDRFTVDAPTIKLAAGSMLEV